MPDRRRAGIAFAAALTTESRQAQTLGVTPVYPVAPIDRGDEACQREIGLAEPFERVRFNVGTFGKPGPALEVTVRSATGAPLGRGRVHAGWKDDGSAQDVPVGRIEPDQVVSVCVRNRGPLRGYVYGDIHSGTIRESIISVRPTVSPSFAEIDGERIPGDMSMAFLHDEPRSLLARVPDMFDHAAAFRPPGVGAWTYWVLLVLLVVAAPLLLWRALRASLDGEPEGGR